MASSLLAIIPKRNTIFKMARPPSGYSSKVWFMWKLQPEPEYAKRVDRRPKKYRRELKAMHDNLDTFFGILCKDVPIEQIHFGFIHDEPSGVKAIDQKGAGTGVKQTR